MATGDLYVGILRTVSTSYTDFLNVFTYLDETALGGVTNASVFADGLATLFLTVLPPVLSAGVTLARVDAFNAFDPTDIGESIISGGEGTVGVETHNAFTAYEFRTDRPRRDIRRGYKRFSGVPESAVVNGVLATAFETDIAFVTAALEQNISTDTDFYAPIIVRRIKYTTPSGNTAYRLPTSAIELGVDYFPANNWNFQRVSSQVSRHLSS